MSHDYHEALPDYSPNQILIDGCAECEERARRDDRGIGNLDPANYRRALDRAYLLERVGLPDASVAELPLLHVLASVQYQNQQLGVSA